MKIRAVVCVLAAVTLTVVGAPPVGALTTSDPAPPEAIHGIGMRLVDAPVNSDNDPRARVYVVDHLNPGAVINRRIEVTNTTDSPAHIVLYPGAATIVSGSFLGAAGNTPNELSTWTSVRPNVSDVPAGAHLMATIAVTVPADAAPGEQYGVVWAETRSAPVDGGGVVQINRIGLRLYVSVGPGGPPTGDFTIDALTARHPANGQLHVLATVRNTGGRALDMNGTLRLSAGPGGLSAGPFPATLGATLAIGDTELVSIPMDERIPAGPWEAQIILRSGLIERTAHATMTFPNVGASPSTSTASPSTTRGGWMSPLLETLIAALVLCVAGVLVVLRRRPPRLTGAPIISAYRAPPEVPSP